MVASAKLRFLRSCLWYTVEICAQMCHMTSRAWKNYLATMPVQLRQWHQCEWQDQDGFLRQAKLPLHGGWWRTWEVSHWPWHVKSVIKTQDKASSIFPNTKLDRLGKLLAACNFAASLFCSAPSLFRSILHRGSCPRVIILAQPPALQNCVLKCAKWPAQLERTFLAPCQYNFKSGTSAIGKTRMPFWGKQNYHCMVAGGELEKYPIGHDMSNQ